VIRGVKVEAPGNLVQIGGRGSEASLGGAPTHALDDLAITAKGSRQNGDLNGDDSVDISDAVFLLGHLFLGGPPPVPIVKGGCGRFVDNGDGTVTDTKTRRTWQQDPPPQLFDRDAASDYCSKLVLGGSSGWRLPEVWELFTILDAEREAPALDPVFGAPSSASYPYWSNTATKDQGYYYFLFFYEVAGPGVGWMTPDVAINVRAVRGP
jgi:hypothetical protein